MFHKLDEVEAHFQDIEVRLTSPAVVSNQILFQKLSKEHSGLQADRKSTRLNSSH